MNIDPDTAEQAPSQLTAKTGWIGWSLVAGCFVGIPAGWLLAYLAALPAFLGLFFYLLIGLFVGATMFRFGGWAPLPSRATLWSIGSAVVLIVWGVSLYAEYRELPRGVYKTVRKSFYESFTPEKCDEVRTGTNEFITSFLKENYPPGGFVGYLRWAATNGALECPRVLNDSTSPFKLPQRRIAWLVRLGLSLLLLGWTVMSQFLSLRPRKSAENS